MGKVAGAGIDKGMEAMPNIWNAMKAAPTNAGGASGLMAQGVDAGIANTIAGAAPSASGTMTAGMGAAGNAGAAAGGAMAGMGAAMPWLGAGLLAGKMFGLFSEGGLVGPLAGIKYKSEGGEISTKHETSGEKAKADAGVFKTIWDTVMGGGMADKAKKKLESRGSQLDEAIKKAGG